MARIFKYGDHTFQDPGPDFTIDDVKQSLAQTFPEVAQATVSEKKLDDGDVEISFVKRSGTKGAETQTTITASTAKEAIAKARAEFAANPDLVWVIATGAATVGGVFLDGIRGDLVLHRSEKGMWTGIKSVEDCKAEISAGIAG